MGITGQNDTFAVAHSHCIKLVWTQEHKNKVKIQIHTQITSCTPCRHGKNQQMKERKKFTPKIKTYKTKENFIQLREIMILLCGSHYWSPPCTVSFSWVFFCPISTGLFDVRHSSLFIFRNWNMQIVAAGLDTFQWKQDFSGKYSA